MLTDVRAVAIIILGAGLYGASLGLWRGPGQAAMNAIKFPLLITLVVAGNAALNGMLAMVMGAPLSFRQTYRAILLSMVILALVLGSLTPVSLALWFNAPPLGSEDTGLGYALIMVAHVFLIALAGVTANVRLYGALRGACRDDSRLALRVLVAWLAGNLLLGSQLSWNLRPFIGSPELETQFFREDAFSGNFFEALHRQGLNLIHRETRHD